MSADAGRLARPRRYVRTHRGSCLAQDVDDLVSLDQLDRPDAAQRAAAGHTDGQRGNGGIVRRFEDDQEVVVAEAEIERLDGRAHRLRRFLDDRLPRLWVVD